MLQTFLIYLLTCFLAGAITPTIIKLEVQNIPPITLTWLRVAGATLILLPFILKNKERIPLKELPKLFPFAINITLFAIGIQYTTLIMSNMLYTLNPLIVAILGLIFLKEKLRTSSIIGLTISLIGVIILIQGSIHALSGFTFGHPLGNLIIAVASFSWAIWFISSRSLTKKYSNTTILFYASVITTIILTLLLPFELKTQPITQNLLTPQIFFPLLVLILVSTVFLQMLFQYLIKNTSAFFASLVCYGTVLFSAVAGIIIFNEKLTPQFIIGGTLVITGVFLATTYQQLKKK